MNPAGLSDEQLAFHRELVEPFYLQLMGFNFLRDDVPGYDPDAWLKTLEQTLPLFADEILVAMMQRGGWRPEKVAAWVIGITGRHHLTPLLEECLMRSPMHREHAIGALFLLGSLEAHQAIEAFARTCLEWLDYHPSPFPNLSWLDYEEFDTAIALAALTLLDKKLDRGAAAAFLEADGLWHSQPERYRALEWYSILSKNPGNGTVLRPPSQEPILEQYLRWRDSEPDKDCLTGKVAGQTLERTLNYYRFIEILERSQRKLQPLLIPSNKD